MDFPTVFFYQTCMTVNRFLDMNFLDHIDTVRTQNFSFCLEAFINFYCFNSICALIWPRSFILNVNQAE